eukprot:CAMPEP_0202865194 /NCGR_PEP_ID=MMETSP1391-20130828/5326_1 /ASSEMBLY_ACC=CAM_ASM_000867 /TAXON_ID=1034604 /ORGANISM="Chlamydomonas leiostraca, Strain SAG 11-49" /LENGTH=128 /DNA_ID=CAMNT_0049544999 /DNA_START=20 /DNA_END=406 /DNA_ORIENTATION=-
MSPLNDDNMLKLMALGSGGFAVGWALPKKHFHDIYFTEKEGYSAAAGRYSTIVNGVFAGSALALADKEVPKKTKKNMLKIAGAGLVAIGANAAYSSAVGAQKKEFGYANAAVLGGFGALSLFQGFRKD